MHRLRAEKATGAPVIGSQIASNALKRTLRVSRVSRPLKGDSEEVRGGSDECRDPFCQGCAYLLRAIQSTPRLSRMGGSVWPAPPANPGTGGSFASQACGSGVA